MAAERRQTPHVRSATLSDLPVLKTFEQGIVEAERPFDETLKPGAISYYDIGAFIEASDTEVAVVEIDGALVASGYAKRERNMDYRTNAEYAHIGFMFVAHEHRGEQLSALILDHLLAWCRDNDIREAHLEVYPDNAPAVRAYEKVGFKPHLVDMRLMID